MPRLLSHVDEPHGSGREPYCGPEELELIWEEIRAWDCVEVRHLVVEAVRRACEAPSLDFDEDICAHMTDDPDAQRAMHSEESGLSLADMSLSGLVALSQAQVPEAKANLRAYAMHM